MVLWSIESVPMKVTWNEWKWKSLSKWWESMRNEWIEVNRVNRGEMKDLKEMTLWTLWEWSYGREKVNPMKVTWNEWFDQTLSKWMDSMRFEWIEVNRSEMSEMSDLNPVRKSLWSIEGVPIKVTWMNLMRMSLSKWSESMRFEWIEVNRVKWSEMSDL